MGLGQLFLVNPAEFPSEVATRRASGATDILATAKQVMTFAEAVEDCVLVMGASARDRRLPWPMVSPVECAELADQARGQGQVAIVFGREDSGLTNDELQHCHYHMHIPADEEYSSLNLAMAVQVMAYELRKRYLASDHVETGGRLPKTPEDAGWDSALASVAEVDGFIGHLEQMLIRIEFHDPDRPRQLMPRLRRLFQRARLDRMEVNILRGILKDILKRMPDERK